MRKLLPILLALIVAAPTHAQSKSSAKHKIPKSTPLTQQERALQLLNRFTFGPRPGDVEKVISQTPERWFEQQLNPADIPDDALIKRLNDYPTLNLPPDRAL